MANGAISESGKDFSKRAKFTRAGPSLSVPKDVGKDSINPVIIQMLHTIWSKFITFEEVVGNV